MIINPETFETNDETFEAGFLIVMVKWYQYDKTDRDGTRYYRPLPQEQYVNANVFLRIDPIMLKRLRGGSWALSSQNHQNFLGNYIGLHSCLTLSVSVEGFTTTGNISYRAIILFIRCHISHPRSVNCTRIIIRGL